MHPAQIKTVDYIICPDCGYDRGFSVSHLYGTPMIKFGPWYCEVCGIVIRGVVNKNNSVDIELVNEPRKIKSLVLLKLDITEKNIYIIIEGNIYDENNDHHEYYYNEHTCPSNYLGFKILEEEDTDPHGIFQFVQEIPLPKDWNDDQYTYNDWCKLFDKLGPIVLNGNSPETPEIMYLPESNTR